MSDRRRMRRRHARRLAFFDAASSACHYLAQINALLDCIAACENPLKQRALLEVARTLTLYYEPVLHDALQRAERALPPAAN